MAKHSKKHRARAGAKAIGKGIMAAAGFLAKRATVIGAAAQYAEEMAEEHIEAIGTKWYGGPGALFVGALLLRKKPDYAKALAGAAGHSGAFNYKLYQFQMGKRDTSPVRDFSDKQTAGGNASTDGTKTTQSYEDTGLRSDSALFN